MDEQRDVVWRITDYLSLGGLFNPESMEHEKVRDLLMACRDEIIAARACAEMMLQGTGQKICESMAMRVLDRRWIPVGERLPEVGGRYLVVTDSDNDPFVDSASWSRGVWWTGSSPAEKWGMEITHWMPLPEPPEVT